MLRLLLEDSLNELLLTSTMPPARASQLLCSKRVTCRSGVGAGAGRPVLGWRGILCRTCCFLDLSWISLPKWPV